MILQGKEKDMAGKKNPDRYAARHIILAQSASDGGKYDWEEAKKRKIPRFLIPSDPHACKRAWTQGYPAKDEHILCALREIARRRGACGIRFFVRPDGDIARYLVYFTFKIEGERYQISFHSFDDRLRRFIKAGDRTHHTRWDHKISRDACCVLAAHVIESGRAL